jgi:hypothetical protein
MEKVRAEILAFNIARTTGARIVIAAPAQKIFDVIADPRSHQLFDGSGTIQNNISGPVRLALGAKFGMAMKIKLPYRITNTVVVFEEGREIAWCHLMKWTWKYELVDLGDGRTQVTESFSGRDIPWYAQRWLNATGALEQNPKWMAKSLVQLKALCER